MATRRQEADEVDAPRKKSPFGTVVHALWLIAWGVGKLLLSAWRLVWTSVGYFYAIAVLYELIKIRGILLRMEEATESPL